MVEGGFAVVEDAHGEAGVEGVGGGGEVFKGEGEYPGGVVGLEEVFDGEVLGDEEGLGVDAEGEGCAGAGDAPGVVSGAATDVEDVAVGEGLDVGEEAVPFPVGAPFGVDMDAVEVVGPFAPGVELHELLAEFGGGGAVGGDAGLEVDGVGGEVGKLVEEGVPLGEVGVALGA